MMSALTAESFETLEGETFTLMSVEPALQLRLIEIARKGKGERMGGSFSLLWQSDSDTILPQGSYVMKNEQMGELELFIVPVGQVSEGVHYEAVFT